MKMDNKSIVEELQKNGLGAVVKLEMDCVPIVAQMEMNGMLIDRTGTERLLSNLKEQLIPIQSDLQEFFGDINLNSPEQLLGACKQKGIQLAGTKKKYLIPLVKDYPILKQLIDYRSLCHQTIPERDMENINPETGRVHPVYNQIVDTGRMSCSHPNIHGIPKQKNSESYL